jgi:tRNA-Thr(GGU) m(6)t(6)A37 methyltransferase TsaA
MKSYVLQPIGIVRSGYTERREAPRQPAADSQRAGRIELVAGRGYEDALEGLASWDHIWVLFVFHLNVEQGRGWRPKIRPPRSTRKQGVFATRSPHRPNPIGMSALSLVGVDGLTLHVRGLDLIDGTPVLDIKPYVAYADALPDSGAGWLAPRDPGPTWTVAFARPARAQLAWLAERGIVLQMAIEATLALGPQPHAYRRIRVRAGGLTLAVKDWRADFVATAERILVGAIRTGYRASQLASDPRLETHREFVARFGA